MKKLLLLIGITAVLFSCTTPMEKKYNEKTALKDIQLIKEAIDSTEFNLLAGSVFRLKFEDKKLEEMTYAEILEEGKKWRAEQEKIEAEQKALAEKAAKDESERIKKLTESVIVSCFEKGYSEVDYQDYITYKFVILNKSDKAIRAVKGGITFTNLFDEKIKSLSFVYDKPIEAGEQVNWDANTEYNQFMSEDKTLKNKDLKDLKVVWNPEKILFEDGTTLE